MKKRIRQLTAAFAAMTMIIGTMPSMAMADTYSALTGTSDDTAVQKIFTSQTGPATIEKSLEIEADANIPAAEFTYTVSAPTASTAPYVIKGDGKNTVSVFQGLNPENIKWTFGNTVGTSGSATATVSFAKQTKAAASAANAKNGTEQASIKVVDKAATAGTKATYIATKAIQLDFTGCGFTEPGIYRYTITETGTNSGITNDVDNNNASKTLDVYVTDDAITSGNENRTLSISGYVLYDGVVTTAPASTVPTGTAGSETTGEDGSTTWTPDGSEASSPKSTGFLNKYETTNLSFGKKVVGNQSSKDKYFKFTLEITGANKNTDYTISNDSVYTKEILTNAVNAATLSLPDNGYTNPTVITTNSEGAATVDFYLKDGDYITVLGLPYTSDTNNTAKFKVYEEKEDYDAEYSGDLSEDTTTGLTKLKNFVTGADDATLVGGTLTEGTGISTATDVVSTDMEYVFQNEKKGVLPTGIIMSVAPAVIVGIGVLAAIFALVLGGKKKELDEE